MTCERRPVAAELAGFAVRSAGGSSLRCVRAELASQQMVEQIRKRLESGFTPFAIRVSDGRSCVVPHRDFIALSPKVVVVIGEDELAVSINPLHIVSLDDVTLTR